MPTGHFQVEHWVNFFTEGVIKHWNPLLREVMESQSLEAFRKQVDRALSAMVLLTRW